MARVITLARHFLQGHPKAGQSTYFVEKAFASLGITDTNYGGTLVNDSVWRVCNPKHHTIRFGRRWKTGDKASLRVWSGKPYRSPQIPIASDVTLRVVNIEVDYDKRAIFIVGNFLPEICTFDIQDPDLINLSSNDGLSPQDFLDWFQVGKRKGVHEAQILIWGNVTEY